MKPAISKFLKFIIFTVLTLLVIAYAALVLIPKFTEDRWASSTTADSFYDLDKDSTDVLFIGSSMMAAGVSPLKLYEDYGISSYNLAMTSQSMLGSYIWLKEALKTQSPKVVVIESRMLGREGEKIENKQRVSYEYLRSFDSRLEYAKEYCSNHEDADLWNYIYPLNIYHDRWSDLKDYDLEYAGDLPQAQARGAVLLDTWESYDNTFLTGEGTEADDTSELAAEYLERMVDLCREEGIEVVMIKTLDSTWDEGMYIHVKKLADALGVTYLDFNTEAVGADAGMDYKTDLADHMHLKVDGQEKLTDYLGKYLMENYALTDYRSEEGQIHDALEEDLNNFERIRDNALLRTETDLTGLLEKLTDTEGYSFLAANGGENNFSFTEEQKELLSQLGLDGVSALAESGISYAGYISVIDEDNDLSRLKEASKKMLSKEGTLADKTAYVVSSKKKEASISIDGVEEAENKGLLNIVVYDQKLKTVAVSFSITADDNGNAILN